MEVSGVSSASSSVMDIYAEKVRSEVEHAQKLAVINMELKMEADKMDMAVAALMDFYA